MALTQQAPMAPRDDRAPEERSSTRHQDRGGHVKSLPTAGRPEQTLAVAALHAGNDIAA